MYILFAQSTINPTPTRIGLRQVLKTQEKLHTYMTNTLKESVTKALVIVTFSKPVILRQCQLGRSSRSIRLSIRLCTGP